MTDPDRAAWTGGVIVDTALDTIAGGVPDHIRADYRACYAGDRFVESMRYVRRLPQISTPVTIINGCNDRVVPVAIVGSLAG